MLIKGKLVDNWLEKEVEEGDFKRMESTFRHWITADEHSDFTAEADRYHLYVSNACPWLTVPLSLENLKN